MYSGCRRRSAELSLSTDLGEQFIARRLFALSTEDAAFGVEYLPAGGEYRQHRCPIRLAIPERLDRIVGAARADHSEHLAPDIHPHQRPRRAGESVHHRPRRKSRHSAPRESRRDQRGDDTDPDRARDPDGHRDTGRLAGPREQNPERDASVVVVLRSDVHGGSRRDLSLAASD